MEQLTTSRRQTRPVRHLNLWLKVVCRAYPLLHIFNSPPAYFCGTKYRVVWRENHEEQRLMIPKELATRPTLTNTRLFLGLGPAIPCVVLLFDLVFV